MADHLLGDPAQGPKPGHCRMAAIVFICPTTDLGVQHWLDEDEDISENEYEVITCPACANLHLIDRRTGKPLVKRESRRNRLN